MIHNKKNVDKTNITPKKDTLAHELDGNHIVLPPKTLRDAPKGLKDSLVQGNPIIKPPKRTMKSHPSSSKKLKIETTSFRLPSNEHEEISKIAQKAGCTKGEFMRRACKVAIQDHSLVQIDADEIPLKTIEKNILHAIAQEHNLSIDDYVRHVILLDIQRTIAKKPHLKPSIK